MTAFYDKDTGDHVYNPTDYGARFDYQRRIITSVTGTALVGGAFVSTLGRVDGDEGKVIYIDGGGASRVLTITTFDPAVTTPKTLFAATVETMTGADVGSLIQIPGAGPAAATLVTYIRAVIDANTVSLRDAPSAVVSGVTGSAQRQHRTTIATVTDATHATLTAACTTNPATVTGQAGPSIGYGTDNAAAFTAMSTAIATKADATQTIVPIRETGHRVFQRIKLPTGVAYTSETNLFPRPSQTTLGFNIKGDGPMTTSIVFGPTTANQFLFEDPTPARWNRIEMEDFEIAAIGHSQPGFYKSASTGAQQGHFFQNLEWSGGAWGDIHYAEATDTNDKWSWVNCRLYATHFDNWYHVPTSTGSQQQLHYQVWGGMWEWIHGNLFNMSRGGNISFHAYGVISGSGTFFKLGGEAQDRGTKILVVSGSRFERRQPAVLLMDCAWSSGNITMIGCTDATPIQQTGGTARTDVGVVFTPNDASTPGYPAFLAQNCIFKGRHEYQYYGVTGNQYLYKNALRYEGCNFVDWTYPEDAFVFTQLDVGTAESGGIPRVSLGRNCRGDTLAGSGQSQVAWETDLNWHASTDGAVTKKLFRLANARGNLAPSSTTDYFLPMNSLLTRVSAFMEAGATAQTTNGIQWLVNQYGTKDAVLSTGGPDLNLLTAATITVASMPAGTPASGSISIKNKTFDRYQITYTGVSGNDFTGCSGGGGNAVDGTIVEVGNAVTLMTIQATGDNPSTGYDQETTTKKRLTTAASRHLQVIPTGVTGHEYPVDVFVEYV